jgi:predicted DsbA family dithiol-disulfide isomerase
MPLGSHQQARDAARAYCCADSLGKGDSMPDALFSANDISQAGCERIAASLGLSLSTFEACVGAAKTDQRIESDIQRFKSSNLRGLPAVFIGRRLLIGMQSIETLRDAFATAAALDGQTGLLRALTWLLRCLGAVVTAVALALPVYAFRRARQ